MGMNRPKLCCHWTSMKSDVAERSSCVRPAIERGAILFGHSNLPGLPPVGTEAVTLPEIHGVISDLDGVVYRGDTPIDDAVTAILDWMEHGVRVAYVTNNSTGTSAHFAAKLGRMGIPTTAEDVVTSGEAAADFVRGRWPNGATVHVVGSDALRDTLRGVGCEVTTGEADAVVVGLDRDFHYDKLSKAADAIRAGAFLIGTNPDRMYPIPGGYIPGAGSILAAVAAAAGLDAPHVVVGKPEPTLVEIARWKLGTDAERTIMIGDQLETDVAAGRNAGLTTVLVKTGVLNHPDFGEAADFEVDSLADLHLGGS